MLNRCNCRATTTNRICRLPFKFVIAHKKLCFIHGRMLFDKPTILIQKSFRAFKVRQKLKNIFNKLPHDLQQKIIWHMREQYYIERQHNVIKNILDKKAYEIFKETSAIKLLSLDYYESAADIYRLYIKYKAITTVQYDYSLYYNRNDIMSHYDTLYKTATYYPQDHSKADEIYKILFDTICKYVVIYKNLYE